MDSKITLTFYDVVSHLFPGAAFLLSLNLFSKIGNQLTEWQAVIYLLVFGYLTGLLLHLIGLVLFRAFYAEDYQEGTLSYHLIKLLDSIIKYTPLLKVKNVSLPIKEELVKEIDKKFKIDLEKKRLGLFSFADTYVAALPFAERDVLSAKEGVYRSLTALALVETVYLSFFVFTDAWLIVALAGILLTEMCRYAREYYRTIKNQQIYTLAFIKMKQ